jgi:hypothetical protein
VNVQFGSGVLYGKPVLGNLPSNPTPFKFGVLQECNVDFKGDLKKLYGQYQLPVATARGKLEVTLKGKLAVFDIGMLNQVYFAQAQSAGYNKTVDGGIGAAQAVNVVTNTATVSNIPIVEDWGVQNGLTGQNLINVASAPAAGQYSVNLTSGVYTLNAADVSGGMTTVRVSYTYFSNVTGAVTVQLANQLMGYAPELSMLLYDNFRNKYLALELNDVTLGSISVSTARRTRTRRTTSASSWPIWRRNGERLLGDLKSLSRFDSNLEQEKRN